MALGQSNIVLAIDDDPDFLEMLDVLLAIEGWRTVRCPDSRKAVEEARRLRPAAVIIDLHMPAITGWEVIDQLRADPATASTHIVICTAAVREMAQQEGRARRLGCDLLLKPFEIDDVLDLLRLDKFRNQAS